MARTTQLCPVCANVTGQLSKDDGETWHCDLCFGTHAGGD